MLSPRITSPQLSFLVLFLLTLALQTVSLPTDDADDTSILARQSGPPNRPFSLRINRGKDPRLPMINGYIEIEGCTGNAVFNKTSGFHGLEFKLDPGPLRGKIYQTGTGWGGYLEPLESQVGTYQLNFESDYPNLPGILYKNFTIQGKDCGGNCGGLALGYSSTDGGVDGWYIVPHPDKVNESGVWLLQWYKDSWKFKLPEGGILVFLWVEWLS